MPSVSDSLRSIPHWLLGLNLVQSRRQNVVAYLAIMLVATALGANPVAVWLSVLTVRSVGRLTIFRAGETGRTPSGG